ncbi:alpha-amylase family glycosyl hydrolase [Paraclostridium bifermentans]|jgi:cyclomaltodextrinase|uniref:alpha-amylase family glycosyl hydrolase n=1 Tax=Paraclostridium bifermentans TaxID=1490 RepID=UPI00189E7F23|nr:alpha-amylase family glycosyl hydrolase [Paraclostridium bifermentans]
MLTSIKNAVFYHIYPLGFCGVINNKKNILSASGFDKFDDKWINHLKNMGINSVYFGPIFQSSYHGYDTIDYLKIDDRLGTNDDFKNIVSKLHANNIRVIIDGVFNHVGRDFWAFVDVKNNKANSQYSSWFNIDFNGNSNYNDGFYYEGWEGHYDLVKLNLYNKNVRDYLLHVVEEWVHEFDIDGIRLDVAYLLNKNFIKELRLTTNKFNNDFWLMGEMIHGDYNSIVSPEMLHSATNYELYKGLYSSHNDKNYFEIAYSLNRQFGEYGIYRNLTLYNFVDNHDVNRIATIINDKRYLNNIYTLLFTIPGVPSIYYGSEWGIEGDKSITDLNLRPELSIDNFDNDDKSKKLEDFITKLISIRKNNKELTLGIYKEFIVKNKQFVFGRYLNDNWIIILLNLDDKEEYIELNSIFKKKDIINLLDENDKYINENNKIIINMKPFSSKILKEI